MALNVGQYQPSGDMMSTINEYWGARDGGSDHNAEWAGANPAEYWTRKYGEALNWKRGQAELAARQHAEETRLKIEAENKKWQDSLKQQSDQYAAQNEQTKAYFQSMSDEASGKAAALRSGLSEAAWNQKNQLSGLLTNMLGSYDTSFNTLKGQLGAYTDNAYAAQLAGTQSADEFAKLSTSLLGTAIQAYNPNLYKPEVATLQAQQSKPGEVFKQAQDKQQETYGWNQAKLKEVQDPYNKGFADKQANTSKAFTDLGTTITNADASVGKAGIYDQGTYNANLSKEASLSQQLRASEQGVLSQLNDMFNYSSTYLNKAESDYNTEKSGRLNERATIQAQQYNDQLGNKVGQAEKGAAQQVNNRRQNTNMSFNPESQNILSYLTRGY
jgi:hypothetical protein